MLALGSTDGALAVVDARLVAAGNPVDAAACACACAAASARLGAQSARIGSPDAVCHGGGTGGLFAPDGLTASDSSQAATVFELALFQRSGVFLQYLVL